MQLFKKGHSDILRTVDFLAAADATCPLHGKLGLNLQLSFINSASLQLGCHSQTTKRLAVSVISPLVVDRCGRLSKII